MFEDAMMWETRRATRSWTYMAGMSIQASLIGLAILIPLVKPDALPRAHWQPSWFMPLVPVGPPSDPPRAERSSGAAARTAVPFSSDRIVEPAGVPDRVTNIVDQVEGPPALDPNSTRVGFGPGSPDGVFGAWGRPDRAVVPPPPVERPAPVKAAEPPAVEIQRIRLGGNVVEGKLLRRILPPYPALARAARISGVVRLMGVIGTDGVIRKLDVVSGHPLLVEAAVNAVRQWVYRPTMLNGAPVEVIAPIDVTFLLNQ